jgi:hypothetical protein
MTIKLMPDFFERPPRKLDMASEEKGVWGSLGGRVGGAVEATLDAQRAARWPATAPWLCNDT